MRDTKLVLVEGLPGSGKSTTTTYLAELLRQRDVPVAAYLETAPGHPLNVGGELHPSGRTIGDEFFRRYTIESFVDESVQRWQAMVRAAEQEATVNILDSYPYQNSVRVLLQLDATLEQLRAYAQQVESVMQPLAPILIYLDRRDLGEAARAISRQRGEAWTAYLVEVATRCPYAQRRGLVGPSGASTLLQTYRGVVTELLGESRLPRVVLMDCASRWDACAEELRAFLAL